MGANPTQIVEFEGNNPYDFDLNPVEIILKHWVMSKQNIHQNTYTGEDVGLVAAAPRMFDLFFDLNVLDKNVQILTAFPDETRRLGIIQWLIAQHADSEIRNYFFSRGVGPSSVDDAQWNMAMTAALVGDLEALRAMHNYCGGRAAAEFFNYRCPVRFNPTVLHSALLAITNGISAERVIQIVQYLVANGADPRQRSMYHNLVEEIDFWLPQTPQYRIEFLKVRKYLVDNESKLFQSFSDCQKFLE